MLRYALYLLIFIFSQSTHAWTVGLGVYKPDPKVQDSKGKEKGDPYSPYINFGWHIPVKYDWFPDFVPRIGYIYNKNNSGDHYTTYKIETFTLLYDFLFQPKGWRSTSLRYGFGSFIQKITGPGGTVTVPNGGGTATAYKPSGSSQSATLTLNAGADYKMNARSSGYLKDYGFSFQTFYFDPGGKASFLAFQVGATGYF